MSSTQQEVDERTRLAGHARFELLLFRTGEGRGSGQRELFGISVLRAAARASSRVAGEASSEST